MSNLWASFQIFISNFRAFYGWYFNLLLVFLVLGLACSLFVRAILRGRDRYKTSALAEQTPDAELTDKAAARLAGLLRFPTVTGQSDAIQNQLAYIKTVYAPLLKKLGFLEMDTGSILLRWKAREKTEELPVLFCGHLDVVPPGDGWREGPFSGSRKDGKIFGRGAIDCKGNVIALLEAVESLIEEGYAPKREIYFAFGHDEETGGHQGAAAIADLMRRRGLAFEMILDEGGFIAEDFMDSPCCAAAMIGLGEKPSCNYKIVVTAAGGHSGVVPIHTTLGILAEAVCRIEASQPHLRVLPVAAEYLQKSSPVMSFGKRLVVSNLPLTRPFLKLAFRRDARTLAMLRSTLAPTRITGSTADNVLPAEATVTVNARLLPGERGEELLAFLKGLLSDLPAEVHLLREDEQVPVSDTDHPMYLLLQRTLEECFPKLPCIPTLIAGGTDSKHYSSMSDCILRFNPFIMTGSNMDTVHGADEYMTERTLGLGVEIYRSLMKRL